MKYILPLVALLSTILPQSSWAQELPVAFQETAKEISMSITLPKAVAYVLSQQDGVTTLTIKSSRRINQKAFLEKLPKAFELKRIVPKRVSSVIEIKTPGYQLEDHSRETSGILVQYTPLKDSTTPKGLRGETVPDENNQADPTKAEAPEMREDVSTSKQVSMVDPTPKPVGKLTIEGDGKQCHLMFEFPEAASLASFLRDGYYWFVFDHPVEVKGTLPRSFGKLDRRTESSLMIFELEGQPDIVAQVTQTGNKWIVSLSKDIETKNTTLKDLHGELLYTDEQIPYYVIPVVHSSIKHSITDPRRGDRLVVCPLKDAGLKFKYPVAFADFRILSSLQGVVIHPEIPQLQVGFGEGKIQISRPRGLRISSKRDRERMLTSRREAQFLNFKQWSRPGESYIETRKRLEQDIAKSPQSKRIEAYYNLIRFHLARGYAMEALGLLRALSDDIPGLIHDPQYLALRSVSYFLSDNATLALYDLNSRELKHVKETHLWKGAVLNKLNQTEGGTALFANNFKQIESLPPYLKVLMALNGAMAALNENEAALAEQLEGIMRNTPIPPTQQKEYELLQAFLADKDDETDLLLTQLTEEQNSITNAVVDIETIHRKLEAAKINTKSAIRLLESLRYSCRGSKIEWRILKDLSQLYIDDRNFKGALNTLSMALQDYPEAPDANEVDQKVKATLQHLFSSNSPPTLRPLTAVSLYEDLMALIPEGGDGDEMIIGLAQNLEILELTHQAADLLKNRYESASSPTPTLAQKYAMALLATDQSKEALNILETAGKLKLTTAERKSLLYLKAKTLTHLGEYEEALKLIHDDKSEGAERMRAGLHWKAEHWNKAAESLWGLLDKDKEKDPKLLMSYATMLYRGKNTEKLKELRDQYSHLLKNSKYKAPFTILTSDDLRANLQLSQLDKHLAQINDFEGLLNAGQE